jgi:putative membrane protein
MAKRGKASFMLEHLRLYAGPEMLYRMAHPETWKEVYVLGLLLRWIVGAITLFVIAYFVPGFHILSWTSAFIAVVVIALLNATLGLLLKILTFPLSILTLGIFLLVINAFVLLLASRLVPGFHVDTFGSAFVGAVVLALVHMLLGMGTKSERR